jgi:Zn-finger nucleic acid-binding protein
MKCPKCDFFLSITNRHGIEIDYCPQCRGVWLDRGELEKIIEHSAELEVPQKSRYADDNYDVQRNSGPRDWGGYPNSRDMRPKKQSGWGDFFDF